MKISYKKMGFFAVVTFFPIGQSTYADSVNPILYEMLNCGTSSMISEKYQAIKKKKKSLRTEKENDYINKINHIQMKSVYEYAIYSYGLESKVKEKTEQQLKAFGNNSSISKEIKKTVRDGNVLYIGSSAMNSLAKHHSKNFEEGFPDKLKGRQRNRMSLDEQQEWNRIYTQKHNSIAQACEADIDDMFNLTGKFSTKPKSPQDKYSDLYQLMVLNVGDSLKQLKALVAFERDHKIKKMSGFETNSKNRRQRYNKLLEQNETKLFATINSINRIDKITDFIQQYRYFEKPVSTVEKKLFNASSNKLRELAPLYKYDILTNTVSPYSFNGYMLSEIAKGDAEAVRKLNRYARDKNNGDLKDLLRQYLYFYNFHNKSCLEGDAQKLTVSGKTADVVLSNGLGMETFRIDGAKYSTTYTLPKRLIEICNKICTAGMSSGNQQSKFGGFLKDKSCNSPIRKKFERNLIRIYKDIY